MTKLNIHTYSIAEWMLILTFAFFFFTRLYFTLRYYIRAIKSRSPEEGILENHISVIIPVRNEEDGIENLIQNILSQKYSNFEIIAVDDFSQDKTSEILGLLAKKYDRLKITGIDHDIRFSEKMSINLGLKAAKSNWVIFINPYVKKLDSDWLSELNNYISDETDLVISYSNIKKGKGITGLIYKLEKYWQYFQGTAFTLGGKTIITDQENVLMKKDFYFKNSGFRTHINKHYANLELLLNESINKKRINIANGKTRMISKAVEIDYRAYKLLVKKALQIRKNLCTIKRWCSFSDEYSRIAMIISSVLIVLFRPIYWYYMLIPLAIYLTLIFIILFLHQRHLKEKKIFLSSLVYILLRPFIFISINVSVYIKDRRLRWN